MRGTEEINIEYEDITIASNIASQVRHFWLTSISTHSSTCCMHRLCHLE